MLRGLWNAISSVRSSSIQLIECSREIVTADRLPDNMLWSNFATPAGQIKLTGARLAHAVVKADYLIARNFTLPSLGFIMQMDQIIDFSSTTNLRLFPGGSSILNDISQTSLTGRVGQGLSLLFADSLGYSFLGHLKSDDAVKAEIKKSGNGKIADFLFENSASDRMILESKATFSLYRNECSPVKSILKDALENQVDPWMTKILPSPRKGYAVYSCLREAGNNTDSSIIFVDPPEQKGGSPVELPRDWVKLRNYAAWLRAMGLPAAANRLMALGSGTTSVGATDVRMSIARIGDQEFAIINPVPSLHSMRFSVGIEVNALKAIISANNGSLDEIRAYKLGFTYAESEVNIPSILSDGTLFGFVHKKDFIGARDFKI